MKKSECTRKVVFTIDSDGWLRREYGYMGPEIDSSEGGFKCHFALLGNENNAEYYELETADGRTNYNDLNAFEKMCTWQCFDYFTGTLKDKHERTTPEWCLKVEEVSACA